MSADTQFVLSKGILRYSIRGVCFFQCCVGARLILFPTTSCKDKSQAFNGTNVALERPDGGEEYYRYNVVINYQHFVYHYNSKRHHLK